MQIPPTIAAHPRRADILAALAAGIPLTRIAATYGLSLATLSRARRHLARVAIARDEHPGEVAEVEEKKGVTAIRERLIARLAQHDDLEDSMIRLAAKARNAKGVAVLLRAQVSRVELLARLAGVLDGASRATGGGTTVNILLPTPQPTASSTTTIDVDADVVDS